MADRRISEFDILTNFTVDMYIPIVDPNAALADDRNLRFTLAQLFGITVTFSGATLTVGGLYPTINVFLAAGGADSLATLPAGSSDIVNMPIFFTNLNNTYFLRVGGDGSDTVDNGGSDPFEIPPGDRKVYTFRWTGTTWLVS